MGRKPADELARSVEAPPRDQVWAILRRDLETTIAAIVEETWVNRHTARSYLMNLEKAGIVEKHVPDEAFASATFVLLEDLGPETPRINSAGELVTQGRGAKNMWRTMKSLRAFTALELAGLASTPETPVTVLAAESYIYHLNRAGYLALLTPGKKGEHSKYRLINWTGPEPPMVQRVKSVFDPNLSMVVEPETFGEAP